MPAGTSHSTKYGSVGSVSVTGEAHAHEGRSPLHLLDLGEASAGAIRELKRGRGELVDEVARALEQVHALLGSDAVGKAILPLVVVVEKKKKVTDMSPMNMFPFSMMR